MLSTIKKRTWDVLGADNHDPNDRLNTWVDSFILVLIITSAICVVIESVDSIHKPLEIYFYKFEVFVVYIFLIEYLLRMWSCTEDQQYEHPIGGRIKFFFDPLTIIDLAAFLPFFFAPLIFDLAGNDFIIIRFFKIGRIFRLLKAARYIESMRLMHRVVVKRKEELVLTGFIVGMLLIVSSSIMFVLEHNVQPDKFPDIPHTMYWSVTTFTTVGYGDVTPVTSVGKCFAALIQLLGIGLFALPTAILGSAFHDELQRKKQQECKCPHCGGEWR